MKAYAAIALGLSLWSCATLKRHIAVEYAAVDVRVVFVKDDGVRDELCRREWRGEPVKNDNGWLIPKNKKLLGCFVPPRDGQAAVIITSPSRPANWEHEISHLVDWIYWNTLED